MFSPSNQKRATRHTEVLKGKISLLELKLIGHPPSPTTRENETLTNKDMPCLPDPQRPMEALTRSKGRSSVSEQRKPCCHERSEYLLQLYHQPSREREQWLHHSLRKFHSNSNSAPKQIGKNDKPKSPRKPGTLRKKIYSEHTATEIDNCSINR